MTQHTLAPVDAPDESQPRGDYLLLPETFFRRLVEYATDATVVIDAGGTLRFANPAARHLFGYPLDELVGTMLVAHVHEDDRAAVASALSLLRAAHLGDHVDLAFRTQARSGAWQLHDATIRSLLEDSIVRGMIMTSRHVPAAGDVLEQLHQTQRIEAISRLAGGVAHDYNNLLTVVTGNTELLLLDHGITGESRTVLEEIALAAERAAALTRQLLAFSRQQVMQPVALSLTELVRRLEQTIVRELGDGITLDIDAEPGVPEVRADPRQLELVILNLASNARKAMPEGGHLRIEVDQVAVTSEHCARLAPMAPGQYARLRVVDAGVGMDAATRARAFEPFFTTGQRGTGQGLGLATVYGIVKQSGGFIWVDSVPGCGTAITAYFPCLPRSPGGRRQEGSTPSNGGTTDTILLVDDDEMVRHTTARTLTRAGYRILLAADAEQALRLARAAGERVNLLLSDIVMPGMNGRELARTLTRERPDLPVLLMSGYGPMHEGDGADEETPFLAKPFTAEELYASVRSLLSATAAAP